MRRFWLVLSAVLVIGAVPVTTQAAPAHPSISTLSADIATRSGRLVITGGSFGGHTRTSHVLVAGVVAPFTIWTDESITAYVPEAVPLGAAAVQVVTPAGSSNIVTVQVHARTAKGRILWRFEQSGMYSVTRPATGPDGTVYSVDVDGHLYALTPNGGLKWIFNGAGPKGLSILPDGGIVTGDESAVTVVNPDGTLRWRYVEDPRAFILLGPNVGPDGNIYAVATEGLGVFSLTPAGELRWSIPEAYDRAIVDYQEIAFGRAGARQQLYFHANHHLKAVSLNGVPKFTLDGDGSQPAVEPDGTVVSHNWTIGAGGVLYGIEPSSGQAQWSFYVSPNNVTTAPDVDLHGNVYVGWNLATMYSLKPGGQQRWKFTEPGGGILNDPIVNPSGTVVLAGGQPNYGRVGYFEAVDAATGTFLWKKRVGRDPDSRSPIVPYSRARFSADGSKAFASAIALGVYDHSFLFGIRTN
jgi:outer membrane protein assembly factor BamB